MTTGPEPRIRTDSGFGPGELTPSHPPRRRRTGRTPPAHRAGPGAPSGWYWTVSIGSSRWRRPSTEPSLRLTWLTWKPDRDGNESPTTWTSWFWAVTWTTSISRSRTGWFAPWWPNRSRVVSAPAARPTIWWPRQIPSSGRPSSMIAFASATGPSSRAGSPGPGDRIRPSMSRARATDARDRVRQDPDPGAAAAHRQDDVRLEPEVHDPDQWTAVLFSPDVDDRRRRHLADEILVLPPGDGPGGPHGGGSVDLAGRRHHAAHAAVRTEVPRERAGVDAGDRGDRPRPAGAPPAGARRRERPPSRWPPRGHAATAASTGRRPPASVVADQRVGHDHDLAGIGRVRADLLVAGLAGVDDEVAARGQRSPEGDAGEHRAVLEREERRAEAPDPGIDDGARARRRWQGRGDHTASDTTNPPASRARWADAGADIDASFAGLTGPVRQPHRTGHERTASG